MKPDAGESEPTDEFHLVTLEPPKNNDATLLIFSTVEDAKIATRLGFNSTAVMNGEGMVPISASITAIKMKYERVVLFGSDKTVEKLKPMLTPGSTIAEFPSEGAFDYESLGDLFNAKGEPAVTEYLNEQLRKPELLKTSLLSNNDTYKMRTKGIASAILNAVDTAQDPRVIVRAGIDNLKSLLLKNGNYPPPLTSISLHGLLGDFVEIAYPTTAACRELLVGSMIPLIGALFGKTNPCTFGSDVHPGATFYLNIARTADGKGQALGHALKALTMLDPAWATNHIHTNVASGEGLIRLAGSKELAMAGKDVNFDGTRLALAIPEMSACFTAQNREGSMLSDMIRNGWDGLKLQNPRSDVRQSTVAVNYTLGISGFITPDLLREVLPSIDWKNGSVNRFLWNVLSETKKIGRSPGVPDFRDWFTRVNKLYSLNRNPMACGEGLGNSQVVEYSKDGEKVWDAWVDTLPEYDDADSMLDGMARAKPHALRLANLYAQLDERRLDGWPMYLEPVHINAAIEHVEHSRASMQWYLDENKALGTNQKGYDGQDTRRLRQLVLRAIEETGAAVLKATEIYKAFSNMTVEQRTEMCLDAGMVPSKSDSGKRGNKATVWTMVNPLAGVRG
jgi:hypothetical protein